MNLKEALKKYNEAINKTFTKEDIQKLIDEYPECEYPLKNILTIIKRQEALDELVEHAQELKMEY